MKKLSKRLIIFGLTVLILLANCLTAFASEDSAAVQGEPVYCENLTILDGGNYYCVLVDTMEGAEVFSYPERQVTKTFVHNILDRSGEFVAKMTLTITGEYSQMENTAVISSVTASYSEAQVSGLSYSVSYNGNTATIYILVNGASIGSLTYQLATNGSLQQIA